MAAAAAAAKEAPPGTGEISIFLRRVLHPRPLESFRTGLQTGVIRVQRIHADGEQEEIRLENIFPFMTLQDLKIAIYKAVGEDALPEFQYLCRPIPGGKTMPIDFTWKMTTAEDEAYSSLNPLKLVSGALPADSRFVEAGGERRVLGFVARERLTIEDMFFKTKAEIPVLNVYLYKDLLAALDPAVPRPITESVWNGRLYPFFPALSASRDRPQGAQITRAKRLLTLFDARQQFFKRLNGLLEKQGGLALSEIGLTGLKFLRLVWPKPRGKFSIESTFYDVAVNARRPYMRLYPVESENISKVFMKDDKTPDIKDPMLLRTWNDQKSPTPQRDFVMAKLLMRPPSFNLPPVYLTGRLFDDGTADVIVEPPRGVRRFDPDTELQELGAILEEGLKGLPYQTMTPELGKSTFLFSIRLAAGRAPYTRSQLRARLGDVQRPGPFAAMFQEIQPLPGERPLAMLRYKLVSNFAQEDRISAFLTQVMDRRLFDAANLEQKLAELVADEFQIDLVEAGRRVAEKLSGQGNVVLVRPEADDYLEQYNVGIDVAIYAQHPFYHFHVYRADSIRSLERILSALVLMFDESTVRLGGEEPAVGAQLVRAEVAEAVNGMGASPAAAAAMRAEEEERAAVGVAAPLNAAPNAAAENEFELVEGNVNVGADASTPVAEAAAAGAALNAATPVVADAEEEGGAGDMPSYLDDLMFDAGDAEGPTIEEAAAAAEAEAAAAAQGAPYVEPQAGAAPGGGAAGGIGAAVLATGSPALDMREELRGEEKALAEELRMAAPPAGAAAKGKAAAPAEAAANENEGPPPAAAAGESYANYFIRRLKEMDRRLFDYKKTDPSVSDYVASCQANYVRQPAVLSYEKFELMRQEYAKDPVKFVVFPLPDGEKFSKADTDTTEYYFVLEYGTSSARQNYYLCCRYFCARDEMLVREVELFGSRMRKPVPRADGRDPMSKDPGQCPFCRGTRITNRRFPGPNETIIERIIKPKTKDSRHEFIGFQKPNPDGFYLPCCFQDYRAIHITDPAFDKYEELNMQAKERLGERTVRPARRRTGAAAALGAAAAAALPAAEEEEAAGLAAGDEDVSRDEAKRALMSYEYVLDTIAIRGIVDDSKLPLEIMGLKGPQIGLLPAAVTKFFGQTEGQFLAYKKFPQKLKRGADGARGFLRVAVENRRMYQADSLLAAIAPFFKGINSAEQMKTLILDRLSGRNISTFLALNYGNLALEFYDPRWPRPSDAVLTAWVHDNLNKDFIPVDGVNKEAAVRAFMSWHKFKLWLLGGKNPIWDVEKEREPEEWKQKEECISTMDPRKEYRQFALMFAQSGLMRADRVGITFVVVEQRRDGSVAVRCPPYGFNKDVMGYNDVGFLFHHYSGIWEPIFYVDNRIEARGVKPYQFLFSQGPKTAPWPAIARTRYQEFLNECSNGSRAFYTSQPAVPKSFAASMAPVSVVRKLMKKAEGIALEGVVRDSYNHLAALLYSEQGKREFVAVPVADDGSLITGYPVYLDWEDYEAPSADVVIQFYKTHVEKRLAAYPGYKAVEKVATAEKGGIVAVRLENMLYVPASGAADAATVTKPQLQWSVNREIALEEKEVEIPGEKERVAQKDFAEIYEHFRLIFSNWLAREGAALRDRMEEIIFPAEGQDLPLYERRKSLEILLMNQHVMDWLTDARPAGGPGAVGTSLLRVDCRVKLDKDTCEGSGRCVWARRGEGGVEQCLLHVPAESPIGHTADGRPAAGARVLLLRLVEELLRYGERRRQIWEGRVSEMAALDQPIKLKGQQYIIPENTQMWQELLRLEWARKVPETPRYMEEMVRRPPAVIAAAAVAAAPAAPAAPPAVVDAAGAAGAEAAAPAAPAPPAAAPAAAAPPSRDLALLLGPQAAVLKLAPMPLAAILALLGAADVPSIPADATALTEEMLKAAVSASKRAAMQIDLRSSPPVILTRRMLRPVDTSIAVIVIQANGESALLTRDPAAPTLLSPEDLSAALESEYKAKVLLK